MFKPFRQEYVTEGYHRKTIGPFIPMISDYDLVKFLSIMQKSFEPVE
jgi:hypothetical protein